ncbi:MAG: hypothetical protein LBO21_10575 [Synergistaceae bacterium]|nr:hypothetical protein [Synergistaceae bacterium]
MEMTTCNVCGKVFGSLSSGTCPTCRKLLDIVYNKARTYLRDNPRSALNSEELSKAIGEDKKLLDILILEGRFDGGDSPKMEESEVEKRRKKLLKDLESNLAFPVKKNAPVTTYGSDRHGKSDI